MHLNNPSRVAAADGVKEYMITMFPSNTFLNGEHLLDFWSFAHYATINIFLVLPTTQPRLTNYPIFKLSILISFQQASPQIFGHTQ